MEEEREIVDCICCWYDFLGFAAPFIKAKWDLNDEKANPSIMRVLDNQWIMSSESLLHDSTRLYINDGLVTNYDLKYTREGLNITINFLETIIRDYISYDRVDKRKGFSGMRGIMTLGHRFAYESTSFHYDTYRGRDVFYHPKEFQMNTAFSKAYIMDEAGSKAGLCGSNLYIDLEVYKYLQNIFRQFQGYSITANPCRGIIDVSIECAGDWFATLQVGNEPIHIDYKGIETSMYRFITMHSIIDDIAREAAFQQAKRYAKMSDED